MKDWMRAIPAEELQTYRKAGFLSQCEIGRACALIVVDVTLGFLGSKGLTLEDAIGEFPTACGPAGWEAVPRIAGLIDQFRSAGAPIVFTHGDPLNTRFTGRATKSKRKTANPPRFNEFPSEIAPRETEWTLAKTRASAFFQTPLTAYLIQQGVDTLVFCGVSTSGCVRASVVDGFSHGFTAIVIDDCCFDRSYFAHCANLFDLDAKYASVLSSSEFETAWRGRPMAKAS